MRWLIFSKRCAKEILRDPLNIVFGLGFPVVLLLLLSLIQSNISVDLFEISSLVPGVSVFGLSFMTLFSATLISKDRESLFAQRLYTMPLRASDFILGYMLPIVPIAVVQSLVCYAVATVLGLPVAINIVYCVLMIIPISVFYVALGLLCGSVLTVKQVGGVCGALLTNLSAWLSGIWFDLNLLGETFVKISNVLPFVHAVENQRATLNGTYSDAWLHLLVVLIYAVITTIVAIVVYLRQMKRR